MYEKISTDSERGFKTRLEPLSQRCPSVQSTGLFCEEESYRAENIGCFEMCVKATNMKIALLSQTLLSLFVFCEEDLTSVICIFICDTFDVRIHFRRMLFCLLVNTLTFSLYFQDKLETSITSHRRNVSVNCCCGTVPVALH